MMNFFAEFFEGFISAFQGISPRGLGEGVAAILVLVVVYILILIPFMGLIVLMAGL